MALPLSNEPLKGGREALPVSAELSEEGGPFSLSPTRRWKEGGRRSLPAGSRRKDRRLRGRIDGGRGSFALRCGLCALAFLPCAQRLDAELNQLLVAAQAAGRFTRGSPAAAPRARCGCPRGPRSTRTCRTRSPRAWDRSR